MRKQALLSIIALAALANTANASFVRDDVLQAVKDTSSELLWQDDAAVKTTQKVWSDAVSYCQNLRLDDYSDWRLPTLDELRSILNQPAFINTTDARLKIYWSSSESGSEAYRLYRCRKSGQL